MMPKNEDFSGTWAFTAQVPVIWSSWVVKPPVKDVFKLIGRVDRLSVETERYEERLSLCSFEIPVWRHQFGSGKPGPPHRLFIPDAIFDEGFIPSASPYPCEHVQSGTYGGELRSGRIAICAGIELADPIDGPWPTDLRTSGLRDHDEDGVPGVSLLFDERGEYKRASFDPMGGLLIEQMNAAFRLRFSYRVRPLSDDSFSGMLLPIGSAAAEGAKWPDALVTGASYLVKNKGVVRSSASASFLNRATATFNPIIDTARPAAIYMWRVAPTTENNVIRQIGCARQDATPHPRSKR